jgi:hypothetical protein
VENYQKVRFFLISGLIILLLYMLYLYTVKIGKNDFGAQFFYTSFVHMLKKKHNLGGFMHQYNES